MKNTTDTAHLVRAVYIYAVSLLSLLFLLIGLGRVVYRSLQYYVFPEAGQYSYDYMVCETGKGMSGEIMPSTEEIAACEAKQQSITKRNEAASFQGEMLSGTVMIIIALPVYILHFFYLRKKL